MREIKFRVWNKKSKVMLGPFDLTNTISMNQFYTLFYRVHSKKLDINHNHVFILFTGIKDKNGNEIYEGDIIKTNEIMQVKFGKYESIYEGIPGIIGFYLDNNQFQVSFTEGSQYEVIGNIYENPELLDERD